MAHFEVFKDKNNKWRFRLKAANGEIIADSEAYNTKQGCLKGVASVQLNASKSYIEIIDNGKIEKTKKQNVKDIDDQEKKYEDPKLPEIVKPEEEIEDEKKVIRTEPNAIKNFFGPRWL